MQNSAYPRLYSPEAQATGEVVAAEAHLEPAGQGEQAMLPSPFENQPLGQSIGADINSSGQYLPAGQAMQVFVAEAE